MVGGATAWWSYLNSELQQPPQHLVPLYMLPLHCPNEEIQGTFTMCTCGFPGADGSVTAPGLCTVQARCPMCTQGRGGLCT